MIKIFIFFLFLKILFFSLAQATTTFVQSEDLQNSDPEAITFNNNGTRMFVIDDSPMVETYTLTTGFDISTKSFSAALSFDLSATNPSPRGIVFNDDGTKMILSNSALNIIENYNLAVAFNPSTAGLLGTHDTSGEVSGERGVVFNNDGSKVYVVEVNAPHEVTEYDLALAYDITTEDGNRSFGFGDQVDTGNVEAIRFNNDGTKMFTVGKTGSEAFVWEYALSTAFDVSTATYTDNFSVNSQDTNPKGLAFNTDGTKMFIVGAQNDKVYEYSLSTGFDLNVTASGNGGNESLSDPTTDKDVVGSIDTQVSNANNSFRQSVGMISNRLSYLRANRNENNLSNQNLKIDFRNTMLASITNALITPISKNKSKSILPNNWSSWTEGSISISKIGDTTNSSRKEIDTQSIAFGFDKKLSEGEVFGYAFQYGQSDTDIGSNGSGIDSKNYNLSLYKSKSLNNDNFVDGLIGIGKIKNDIDRKSGSNTLTGSRDGNQLFGSLNLGKKINKGDFDLTPTIRIDLGYTELDEYQEVGTNALFYDDQHIQSGMVSLGFGFNNIVKFDSGSFKPFGSIEYGLDMSDSSDTRINYISDTSTQYTYKHDVNSEHLIKSEIGFNYETKDNFFISSSYQRMQGEKHEHTDTLKFSLNFKSKRKTEYAIQFGGTEDFSAGLNVAKNINGLDFSFKLDQEFNENFDKNAEISMIKKF